METNPKYYWEKVYETKTPDQVGWTQTVPKTSLNFIKSFKLSKKSKIIDIGGGDSKLVDFLLNEGFENITILDISEKALERAKLRLGKKAKKVNWIVSNVLDFVPDTSYDLWHDRAAFHFLTEQFQIAKYLNIAQKSIQNYLVLATFSEKGPKKCSGLTVQRYSENLITEKLKNNFSKIRCIKENHITPSKSTQNYLFCSFKKVNQN
ncbi:MAG: class I SAM-dependent methyltransferase [Bacteroidales bacterium]|nr:class I SAM-dependent methyltransferase [Bacteroidales bacterium]